MERYEDKIGLFVNVEYWTSEKKIFTAKGILVGVDDFKIIIESKKNNKYWEIPIKRIGTFHAEPNKGDE